MEEQGRKGEAVANRSSTCFRGYSPEPGSLFKLFVGVRVFRHDSRLATAPDPTTSERCSWKEQPSYTRLGASAFKDSKSHAPPTGRARRVASLAVANRPSAAREARCGLAWWAPGMNQHHAQQ